MRYVVALALVGCGEEVVGRVDSPPLDYEVVVGTIDCDAIISTYRSRCVDQLGISTDTVACAALQAARGTPNIERAAIVCDQSGDDCDRLFVCLADEQGLSALSTNGHVTGSAKVEGESFTFDTHNNYVWLGTKASGGPGDFEALFSHQGRPWYFKLEDFAERTLESPFVVDALRPIKLENGEDNVEIAIGEVVIHAFVLGGNYDIEATATDASTGERIAVRIQGSF